MQLHILYLAGLDHVHRTDPPTIARYEARARVERAHGVHDAFAALRSPIATALRAGLRRYRRWRLARATIGELERLDDRMLRDIGVSRSRIRGLAWSIAEQATRTGPPATGGTGDERPRGTREAAQRKRAA